MLARQRDAYLAHVTVERGLSVNTVGAYRRDLARYVAFLEARGRTDLAEVTRDDVAEFAQSLGDAPVSSDGEIGAALAPASASRIVVSVRGLHKFGALEGWTPVDVSAAVRPRAIPKKLPHPISTDEVAAILENASVGDGPAPLRDRALLEFLYGSGARISEATGLDVDDVSFEPGAESVLLRGKGRKERVVPLGSFAAEALSAYLVRGRPALRGGSPARGAPAVFLNSRGGRLSRQSAWAILARGLGARRRARRLAAHPAPLVRDAPAAGRGGRARGAGAAGPRERHHDADLHRRDSGHPARGLRDEPSSLALSAVARCLALVRCMLACRTPW